MLPPDLIGEVRAHTSLSAIIGRDVKLKRAGRELKGCCPFHSERTPSFHVNDAKGLYHCFGCGASGDAVAYVMHRHGLPFADAVRMLAGEAGLTIPEGDTKITTRQASPKIAAPLPDEPDADAEEVASTRRKREIALRIWAQAVQPEGTPVEAYLHGRGVALPETCARVLRYHPQCPNGTDVMPAMVALIRDPETDEPLGIHRTFLTLNGKRALGSDGGKLAKKMLGTGRGVVMLSPGLGLNGEGPGEFLAIAEGIETALHGLRRWPHIPVWCAMNAGGVAAFPVLRGIEHITIYADNDASGAGMNAARACARRWAAAGRHGAILLPNETGQDFADLGELTDALQEDR